MKKTNLKHNFRAALVIFATLVSSHVFAAVTDWAEDTGGRMRLIVTAPDEDGTIRGALQVEPAPGFITYWREPGESGIPPHISVSGSDDVRLSRMQYPTPERMEIAGGYDMGYDQAVTFPLTFSAKVGRLPDMSVSAFIGLCKNICIPFQASFNIPPEAGAYKTSPVETAILAVAETRLPENPSSDFDVKSARLSEEGIALSLNLPNGNGKPEIIIASSKGFVIAAPDGAWKDHVYAVAIPASQIPEGATGTDAEWSVLVKSGGRAMETLLVFDTRQN